MGNIFESNRPLSFQEKLNALMEAKQKKENNMASLRSKHVVENTSRMAELDAIDKETEKKLATEAALDKFREETLESARVRGLAGLEKRLYTEGCRMLWDKVLFETVFDACWIDDEVKSSIMEAMYSRYKATMEFASTVCESSVTKNPNRMLCSINDVIMETAAIAAKRIAMEAKGDPDAKPEKINFDLTMDEEDKMDDDLKNLGKDEIVDLVKDKVLTTVQDEKEASKKKAESLKEVEDAGKDDDDPNDSDDVDDSDEDDDDSDKSEDDDKESKSDKSDDDSEDDDESDDKDDKKSKSKKKSDDDKSDSEDNDDDDSDKSEDDDKDSKSKSKKKKKDDDDEGEDVTESTVILKLDGETITYGDWCNILESTFAGLSYVTEASDKNKEIPAEKLDKINFIARKLFRTVGISEAEAKDSTLVKKKLSGILMDPGASDNKKYVIIQMILMLLALIIPFGAGFAADVAFFGASGIAMWIGYLIGLIGMCVVGFKTLDGPMQSKIKIIRNQIKSMKSKTKDPKIIAKLQKSEDECTKALARSLGVAVSEGFELNVAAPEDFYDATSALYTTLYKYAKKNTKTDGGMKLFKSDRVNVKDKNLLLISKVKSVSRIIDIPYGEACDIVKKSGFKEGNAKILGGGRYFLKKLKEGFCEVNVDEYIRSEVTGTTTSSGFETTGGGGSILVGVISGAGGGVGYSNQKSVASINLKQCRVTVYYRENASMSIRNRYNVEGTVIHGRSDYEIALETKVREKERRRLNNSYGESLFEALMMYNRVGVESDAVYEGVTIDMKHTYDASMMEAILNYTVLETLNTMGIYNFTSSDTTNMKKALLEDMNAMSMQMGNKNGKKMTRIGTMKFKRNKDKQVMSSKPTSPTM